MNESSPTSESHDNRSNPVEDLKRAADEAAAFTRELDKLLQSIALVDGMTTGLTYEQTLMLPRGCLGFFAALHMRLGQGKFQGLPPNPAFTRESYIQHCIMTYDVLNLYYNADNTEHQHENDGRSNGEGTQRGPRE